MPKLSTKTKIKDPQDPTIHCFNDQKVARLREKLSNKEDLDVVSQRFKVLGHVVRLQILEMLAAEECGVCDLANILQSPVSTLSQHLKTLKNVGLVQSRQIGKFVMYSLQSDAIANTGNALMQSAQPRRETL